MFTGRMLPVRVLFLMRVSFLIMPFQGIFPKVIGQIAYHRVNMVRFILSVVILDQQHRPVNAVIMSFPYARRSEEHTSELQSLMRISYAVFCLKKKNNI